MVSEVITLKIFYEYAYRWAAIEESHFNGYIGTLNAEVGYTDGHRGNTFSGIGYIRNYYN